MIMKSRSSGRNFVTISFKLVTQIPCFGLPTTTFALFPHLYGVEFIFTENNSTCDFLAH